MYVLIDLERTIGTGVTHYWKRSKFGYVTDINEAGRFSRQEADNIVDLDLDFRTVKVGVKVVEKILEG